MVDLAAGSLLRTLKSGHSNIASSVRFRGSDRRWEVVTGGLDCQMIKWNVSSGQSLKSWKLGKSPALFSLFSPQTPHTFPPSPCMAGAIAF